MARSEATCVVWAASVVLWAVTHLLLLPSPVFPQSSSCNRAQQIVDEVRVMPQESVRDHHAILARLETAKDLCPGLGEPWKLAYCSALALGQEAKANGYRKRAALNGIVELACTERREEAAPAAARLGPVQDKFALVVGIGTFADPAIPSLRFTAKDARDFAGFLIQQGNFAPENVFLLVDEQASREEILDRLNTLILRAEEDDLVVLYISSHGSPHRAGQGLGGIGYLVTHDSRLDRIWIDGIGYSDFSRKVSLIRSRRTVTFLDTCFSGQSLPSDGAKQLSIEGLGVDQKTAEMFLSGEGDYVITSSKADEQSWESEELENSYFTYYLLEALSAGEGMPTIRQVFDQLSRTVARVVAEEKGVGQHPQIHPSDGPGDLKLSVLPEVGIQ